LYARVLECCTYAGDVKLEALPSLWDAVVKIAIGALANKAVIQHVPRSPCITTFLNMLKSLGFIVFQAGDKVEIEYGGGEGRQRIYYNIDCGLHHAAVAVAVASRYLRPPQQLILGAKNEYMLHADLRAILELATSLGLRAWPGGSLSKLIIIEPSSPEPLKKPIKLTTRHGYVIVAALIAAASYGGTVYNSYGLVSDKVVGNRRVSNVIQTLTGLELPIEWRENLAKVPNITYENLNLKVENSYTATLTLLALLTACKAVKDVELYNLPSKDHPDASDFKYLAEVMGYNLSAQCNETCTISLEKKVDSKPLTVTYSIYDQPDLLYPLAAYVPIAGGATISGLKAYEAEKPISKLLESTLQEIFMEAYLEDDDDRLVVLGYKITEQQAIKQKIFTCPPAAVTCLPLISHSLVKCEGGAEGVEIVESQLPGLLEYVLQVGLPVDIA
jgi:hypothetical protein